MNRPELHQAGFLDVEFGAPEGGRAAISTAAGSAMIAVSARSPRSSRRARQSECAPGAVAGLVRGLGVMFINNTFAGGGPCGRKELWRETEIGNRVSIGSNATNLPVRIVDNVVIGAGAFTKDITEPGIHAGNPARRLRRK